MVFRKKINLIYVVIIGLNVGLIYFWVFVGFESFLRVVFLDIGQGDSVLIQTPYDQNILIDVGDGEFITRELGRELGWMDKRIDLLVLTHPHEDHIGGAVDVLKRYDVGLVVHSGVFYKSPVIEAVKSYIEVGGIEERVVDRRMVLTLGKGCLLEFVYPYYSVVGKEFENVNESSLVSRLDCAGKRFLFVGDIEEGVERELVEGGVGIRADVLKVGHHGSNTSSSEEFLEVIGAEIAVIQVGEGNDFGHPSLRVLNRLERLGVREIYRNDVDGVVELIVKDGVVRRVE